MCLKSLFTKSLNQILINLIQQMGKQQQKARRHSAPNPTTEYIGRFQQTPKYVQDNQHIRQGYRIGYDSPKKVMKSLFMVHNQTVNIWTHLIGAIIVIFFIFEAIAYGMEESHILGKAIIKPAVSPYKLPSGPNLLEMCEMLNQGLEPGEEPFQCTAIEPNKSDQSDSERFDSMVPSWPILFALLGGSICLSCSAVFHWIYQMNEKIYKISLSLDFAGIGMNMAFSPIPAFYYAFYCDKQTAFTYLAIIIIAGTISFISNLFQWTHRPENRVFRFSILTVSSITCAIGLVHIMINEFAFGNYGDPYTIKPSLYFFVPTLMCYGIGFLFYLTQCPERKRPGHYDICGHSHQIWHVFVFLAIIFTYLGSIASYEMRSQYSTCPVTLQADFQ